VAPGIVTTEGNIRTIQHLEGGIVSEIAVQNGQLIKAGDLLVRLDSTQRQASSSLYESELLSTTARKSRLEAELRLADQIAFPQDVINAAQTFPEIARVVADETGQFEVKKNSLARTVEILQSQIAQLEEQTKATELQRSIAEQQLALVDADVKRIRDLREQGLAQQSQLTALETDSLSLQERIASSGIIVAQTAQQMSSLELEIEQASEDYRDNAAENLQRVTQEIRALTRDNIVAADSLRRVEIRSPVTGTVQESDVFTIGAVVQPGQVIMRIAPSSEDFVITARVSPNDIDAITPGSAAEIRFPAFQNLEIAPFPGKLMTLSRDIIVDEATQQTYYQALVRMDANSVPGEVKDRLVAGMSADVILPTGERTALTYLLSPLLRRLNGAMREK
jgi:membrane fusion protein, type I secretion system